MSDENSKYGDYAATGAALESLTDTITRRGGKIRGLAIPWFSREAWPRLLLVSVDRQNLPHRFNEFEQSAGKRFDEFVAAGHPCEKVLIDVDELVAWCLARGVPVDGHARAAFAGYVLSRRDATAGNA